MALALSPSMEEMSTPSLHPLRMASTRWDGIVVTASFRS